MCKAVCISRWFNNKWPVVAILHGALQYNFKCVVWAAKHLEERWLTLLYIW